MGIYQFIINRFFEGSYCNFATININCTLPNDPDIFPIKIFIEKCDDLNLLSVSQGIINFLQAHYL